MAHPQYNQFQQNMHSMPPLQTQGQAQPPRAFSPPSYQQSPGAMSPTGGVVPPAKRQRLSPTPTPASPYNSHFGGSPYGTSPYAASPPGNYLSLPQSPANSQPSHSFNQPQPYQHPNAMDSRPPPQGSMPPPRVPASRAQDNAELEKANPREMDVNNISDVLTGSGIDLRAEEEMMLNVGSRSYGVSFNSQASGSTVSPHGSFNQWGQQGSHGAFQGSGPLSQPMTKEQQEAELLRKHEQAARILNETASQPLTDPFLFAGALRQRVAKRAYEHSIQVNLEGLFDKIPERVPQNVTRTSIGNNSNGESIVGLQASSLLNQNAPLVEILSLLSLAAEERIRTVVEGSFALSQGRQSTSHGLVPPQLADIAVASGNTEPKTVAPVNISQTAWEAAPDSAVSPLTVTAHKQPPNAARLPTPPSDTSPIPLPTIQVTTNHVTSGLKRRVEEDERFERERIRKRQKRLQGSSATPADTPTLAPLPIPEKMTKKERDRQNKMGQTEEVLHRKANETASMALGGKKKYSWMTGGTASGTSTPRLNTSVGVASGTATPVPQTDRGLIARKRMFQGGSLETTDMGKKIQIRDLVHVLEDDGRERKTLVQILARLRSTDKDDRKEDRRTAVAPAR